MTVIIANILELIVGFIRCLGTKGTAMKKGSEQVLYSDGIF